MDVRPVHYIVSNAYPGASADTFHLLEFTF